MFRKLLRKDDSFTIKEVSEEVVRVNPLTERQTEIARNIYKRQGLKFYY